MMQNLVFLRHKFIHYHGILHALVLTLLIAVLNNTLFNQVQVDTPVLLTSTKGAIIGGVVLVYLLFAIYQYAIVYGKRSFVIFLHAGIIISYLHPFLITALNVATGAGYFHVSPSYMVVLMFIACIAAAIIYLINPTEEKEQQKAGRADILDDDFTKPS